MEIKELKDRINKNTLSSDFMIWVAEDETSDIIINQYIKKICDNKHLTPKIIDSYNEIPDESFCVDNNLYIIKEDKPKEIKPHNNCILVCNKTNNKEAIKIPKLESWQVVDFISARVPGINKKELEWLSSQYGKNYGRMINDLDKISIFPEKQQSDVYNKLLEESQFKDISSLVIWDLVNGLIRKDKELVKKVLEVIEYIDIEPLGLLTSLYNGFKNVIKIQLGNNTTAESMGLSGKQFFVIKKYNCNHYTREQLVKIFDIITNLEYRFKYEGIDKEQLIDYLIVNILGE